MSIHSLGISTLKPKHWEIFLKGLRSGFCEIVFKKFSWDIIWRGKSVGTENETLFGYRDMWWEKVGWTKLKGIKARLIRCWTNARWMNTKYDFIDYVTDAYTQKTYQVLY